MNWIKNLLIVILSTIGAVKGADLLLAYSGSTTQFPIEDSGVERYVNLKEINPNFKANYVPTDEYLNGTDSLERMEYLVRTDEDGFIENGNKINFAQSYETIMFFGGSTTETLFVNEEQRWQSILERNLNKKQHVPKFKIINAGVSGNNSMHSTVNLVAKGLQQNPKFAVLMHNCNDYALLRLTGSYWNAPAEKALVQIKGNVSLKNILFKIKDFLAPNLYELYKTVEFKFSDQDDFRSVRGEETVDLEIVEANFRASLNTFINVSMAWDIEPILMTQFNRINSDDEFFKSIYQGQDFLQYIEGYRRLNDVIREVSVSRNVDLIDLDKLIPSTSDYIYDAVHLNENGSQLVAEILTNYWMNKLSISD